jgi:hypothetical protein
VSTFALLRAVAGILVVAFTTAAPLDVTFSETAELILEPNGDIVLEFDPICEMVWNASLQRDECTFPPRFVRYSDVTGLTEGQGHLFGSGDDGSVWTIDLGQIRWTDSTRILTGNLSPLVVHEVGGFGRAGMTSFSW